MKYKVGDIVELIYLDVVGTGEIIRIDEGFFSNKYLIKTIMSYSIRGGERSETKVITVKEKDIIKLIK